MDYRTVLAHSEQRSAVLLDVRPADFFSGAKRDEARAGHIPGAVNRPFSEDVATTDGITRFHATRRTGAGVIRPLALRKLKMATS